METSEKSEKSKKPKLNHYTTYDALLKILDGGLRFSDPEGWEDKNDAELLKIYKKKLGYKTLLVLCFSHLSETIYHWEKFANKKNKIGCCIEFNKKKLLIKVESNLGYKDTNYRCDNIKCREITEMNSDNVKIEDFPFTKRHPYRIEKEYRIIYQNKKKVKNIFINNLIDCIKKITLSGKISKNEFSKKRKYLKRKYKISKKKINHSTIYKNKKWIKQAKNIASNTNSTNSEE